MMDSVVFMVTQEDLDSYNRLIAALLQLNQILQIPLVPQTEVLLTSSFLTNRKIDVLETFRDFEFRATVLLTQLKIEFALRYGIWVETSGEDAIFYNELIWDGTRLIGKTELSRNVNDGQTWLDSMWVVATYLINYSQVFLTEVTKRKNSGIISNV